MDVSSSAAPAPPGPNPSLLSRSGDPARPLVMRRVMERGGGRDRPFSINGRSMGIQEFQKMVRSLNIQLDNLCQFLPQDRVAAFAMMTPTELLRATEQAIGRGELEDLHNELIKLSAEVHKTTADLKTSRE